MEVPISDYPYEPGHESCTSGYVWPIVLGLLAPARDQHVLDAGCGDGSFLERLEAVGYRASGFDSSESGVALARARITRGTVLRASGYEDLSSVFGRRFGAVTAIEVIEHLYAPRLFLRQLWKAMEPGSPLIVSTPYHGYLKNLALALTGKLDAHFTVLWDNGHIKFFSTPTIRSMLEECGFRVVSIQGAGRLRWFWKSMVVLAIRQDDPSPAEANRRST